MSEITVLWSFLKIKVAVCQRVSSEIGVLFDVEAIQPQCIFCFCLTKCNVLLSSPVVLDSRITKDTLKNWKMERLKHRIAAKSQIQKPLYITSSQQ